MKYISLEFRIIDYTSTGSEKQANILEQPLQPATSLTHLTTVKNGKLILRHPVVQALFEVVKHKIIKHVIIQISRILNFGLAYSLQQCIIQTNNTQNHTITIKS